MANNASSPRTVFVPYEQTFAALEALPPRLRDALNEVAVPINPTDVWAAYQATAAKVPAVVAERMLLQTLARTEADELARFNLHHMSRYGSELPHITAAATTLRAGPVGTHRRRAR